MAVVVRDELGAMGFLDDAELGKTWSASGLHSGRPRTALISREPAARRPPASAGVAALAGQARRGAGMRVNEPKDPAALAVSNAASRR
jgi:hypothetical protein